MTIPVFYSISDDFTKYAAVSLNSLVKNSSPENDYTVTFLNHAWFTITYSLSHGTLIMFNTKITSGSTLKRRPSMKNYEPN